MKGKHKTHCKYGHLMDKNNTRIKHKKRANGIVIEHECKECHRMHELESWHRRQSVSRGKIIRLEVTKEPTHANK